MNKIFIFIFVSFTVFLTLLGLDSKVQSELNSGASSIRSFFVENSIFIENFTYKYYNQASNIEDLTKKLETEMQKNLILTKELHKVTHNVNAKLGIDLNRSTEQNSTDKSKPQKEIKSYTLKLNGTLQRVIALSYVNFKDFTKIYLDLPQNDTKVKGLIYDNHTAGIVVVENGKSIALLNTNEKCGYSVYVGTNKVPGVTAGIRYSNKLVVKYIPVWMQVKAGDEVYTSGMDGIFFEGLKVGKVVEVRRAPMYQEAIVEPNQEALNQRIFMMYATK